MKSDKDIYRIIDANLNRSREGLRVCEEITRFVLNSPALTRELKSIRHKISNAAKDGSVGHSRLCASRDSEADIGRCSKLPSEMKRADLVDIFAANMERAKESIRVLEEVFKLIDKGTSAGFAKLRFRAYEVEKKTVKEICSFKKGNTRRCHY